MAEVALAAKTESGASMKVISMWSLSAIESLLYTTAAVSDLLTERS